MAKKYSSVLGVDIGSQNIKIAEIKLQGKSPVVTAWGIAQTPQGAADHIGIHDPEPIAQTLKQLCAMVGSSATDVVVNMTGQGSVLVRTLEVPVMNDAELRQHMDWEVTRNIPFAESTVTSDYKAYPPEPTTPQNMDVVMAIATQSSVMGMVSLLKKAGKKPAAFDVEPLGLGRALQTCYGPQFDEKRVCLVDIGHKASSINIYRDAKLVMPRQIPIGGEMFTRAIADGIGVPFEEAQFLKHSKAELNAAAATAQAFNPFEQDFGGASTQQMSAYNPFADLDAPAAPEPEPVPDFNAPVSAPVPAQTQDPEVARLSQAMAAVTDEFVAEIRRSLDYYRGKGGDVDAIVLCGGGAKLNGLSAYLEAALGVPTSVFDPFGNVPANSKKSDMALLEEHRPDFAMAVGTALHICY